MDTKNRHPLKASATRRAFLQRAAGTGLATAAGIAFIPGLSAAQSQDPFAWITLTDQLKAAAQAGGNSADLGILNFALLLERLEATFYNTNYNKPYLTNPTPGTQLTALLVGSEQAPTSVNTNAVALGRFTLSPDQTQLFYDVRSTGLSGEATSIRLFNGARGTTGNIAYTLATPVNGVSTGVITLNPTDMNTLVNQGMYVNIATAANPNGEIRGQVIAAPPGILSTTTPALKSMVDEIRDHENAHVSLLEQALGSNAQAAPTFQNLDAPTLQQFLTMAQMFEDIGTSAYLGQAPLIQDKTILATAGAIMAVEARHAGGLRAYRKVASPAEGGDASITLTEDRESLNRARTRDQVMALIQPFIATGATPVTPATPGNGTVTNPGTNTGNNGTTTPSTGTNNGTTPSTGTNNGTTPSTGTNNGTTPSTGGSNNGTTPTGGVNPPAVSPAGGVTPTQQA
jgi:hypothetical protein